MIDTIKIYAEIDENTYNEIHNNSIIKSSYDNSTGELFYNITTGFLNGSYDNRLSVRVDSGVKYGFVNKGYCIEIEGSLHKYFKGYNAFNGYYDLEFMCKEMIRIAELSYFVKFLFNDSLNSFFAFNSYYNKDVILLIAIIYKIKIMLFRILIVCALASILVEKPSFFIMRAYI